MRIKKSQLVTASYSFPGNVLIRKVERKSKRKRRKSGDEMGIGRKKNQGKKRKRESISERASVLRSWWIEAHAPRPAIER